MIRNQKLIKHKYFILEGLQKFLNAYKQAINDFNKAIELDSNFLDAYYDRGISKQNLKDHKEAITDFNKAIELGYNYVAYNKRSFKR